eukprot:TRINITY_DN776041_c0_g1_i1.p1 TRINITY_DN776041_c0_g1~~TRINITY_DN776041_c0_g1_i1.p1  ORF type:complete len:809 (+),score=197.92 TRINITY_DN776041_c0_g1_i1:125-2551(+)
METLESIPFIVEGAKNQFEVSAEAKKFLSEIDGKIAVISVAGLYRTGKSYLLNKLMELNGLNGEFRIGTTVNSCTRGLWIPKKHIKVGDTSLIFLDTEGLGSTDRSKSFDCRIFSLAILLSSQFILNTRGVIDGSTLENLSLIAQLTKHIQSTQSGGKGSDFQDFFPSLMWVVRDFSLRLETTDQGKMTPKMYLENALKPMEGYEDEILRHNQIRSTLRNFFPNRDCSLLIRPVADEQVLKNLNEVEFSSLRPGFQKQVTALNKKIIEGACASPKMMFGHTVSGEMLSGLAESYVEAMNTGAVPTINNAWSRVLAQQNQKALANALECYEIEISNGLKLAKEKLQKEMKLEEVALSEKELMMLHGHAKALAETAFTSEVIYSDESSSGDSEAKEELLAALNIRKEELLKANKLVSDNMVENAFSNINQANMQLRFEIQLEEQISDNKMCLDSVEGFFAETERSLLEELNSFARSTTGPSQWSQTQLERFVQLSCSVQRKCVNRLVRQWKDENQNASNRELHLVSQVDNLEKDLNKAKNTAKKQKESFDAQMSQTVREHEKELGFLKIQVDDKQVELDRLHSQMDGLQQLQKERETHNASMVSKMETRLNESQESLKRLRERLEESESQQRKSTELFHKKQMELMDDNRKKEERMQEERLKVKQEIKAKEVEWETQKSSLTEQINILQEDLRDASVELATESEQKASLQERTESLEGEIDLITDTAELLKEHLDAIRKQKEALKAEREEIEFQLALAKAQYCQIEHEKLALKDEIYTSMRIIKAYKKKGVKIQLDRKERLYSDSLDKYS